MDYCRQPKCRTFSLCFVLVSGLASIVAFMLIEANRQSRSAQSDPLAVAEFSLGNGTRLRFGHNKSLHLMNSNNETILLSDIAVTRILENYELCCANGGTYKLDNETSMKCQFQSKKVKAVKIVQNMTDVSVNSHQLINFMIVIWHKYIFQEVSPTNAALIPLGGDVFVHVCRSPQQMANSLVIIRKFKNGQPLPTGINMTKEQTVKLFTETRCRFGETSHFYLGNGILLECRLDLLWAGVQEIAIRQYDREWTPTIRGITLSLWQFANLDRLKTHIMERLLLTRVKNCNEI